MGEHLAQRLVQPGAGADPAGHRVDVALDQAATALALAGSASPCRRLGRHGLRSHRPRSRRGVRRHRGSRLRDQEPLGVDLERELRERPGAGPPTGRAASTGSNTDWWHGQTSWRSVSGGRLSTPSSPTEQPAWVQILEYATHPLIAPPATVRSRQRLGWEPHHDDLRVVDADRPFGEDGAELIESLGFAVDRQVLGRDESLAGSPRRAAPLGTRLAARASRWARRTRPAC